MSYDKFYVPSHPGGAGVNFGFTVDGGIGGVVLYLISGQILDSAGAGLDSVTVTLTGEDDPVEVTTAGGGLYAFSAPNGLYTVTPTLAGSTFSPTERAVTVDGANVTPGDMTQVWVIDGVINDSSGAGLVGVTVALSGDGTGTTTTAADGTYSFAGLTDGTYTLTPTLLGSTFSPTSVNVTISGDDETASTMTQVWAVDGVINDSAGDGLDGVTVSLTGDATDSVVTSGGGTYTFMVPDGSYTVTPTLLGSTFSPTSANVTVSGADETAGTMTQVWAINGVINSSAGAGLDGVTITLTGDGAGSVVTSGGGTYTFMVPDGSYTVTPTLAGSTFSPTSANVAISGSGQSATTMAQVWVISGYILDGSDVGIDGVTVTLTGP